MQRYQISEEDDGIRLDRWFKRHWPEVPFGLLQKALRKGQIRVEGKKAEASQRLVAKGWVECHHLDLKEIAATTPDSHGTACRAKTTYRAPKLTDEEIRETQSWVIYKDANVIAINKPYGLAVQGGSKLKDFLDRRMSALQFDASAPPKLVHRIDKDTSGVLVLARSAKAATELMKAFSGKQMEKFYWALVVGVPQPYDGVIEGKLHKSDVGAGKEKMRIDDEGKYAKTLYRVVEPMAGKLAWVELQPVTGRTHQLRVHMAEFGFPILGDGKYGGAKAFVKGIDATDKLHLHARRIVIPNCFGKTLDIAAPLAAHMKATWKQFDLSERDAD